MDLQSSRSIVIKRGIYYTLPVALLSLIVLFLLLHPYSSILFSQILDINRNSVSPQSCDYSYGKWVRDQSRIYHLYSENCSFLDPGFRCGQNGRMDVDFLRWRWQPHACTMPRFDARDMLERIRNRRVVFAGDSLGRNQWESLVCMLAAGVDNQSSIYEEKGRPITKHKGFLSIRFNDYNLTVEYYRAPFLVSVGRAPPNSSHQVHTALMLDILHRHSTNWLGADILVFNTGHWWNKDKTSKMGTFFHENGIVNMTMDTMEAFRRSLRTWKEWATKMLGSTGTKIFFRSYSPLHYSGGSWDNGGRCDDNVAPEMNKTKIDPEPEKNRFIYDVIKDMIRANISAQFLNITYLSEFRNDGHPSIYREPGTRDHAVQDCSHWCLPGVPDTWNELLYAHLIMKNTLLK